MKNRIFMNEGKNHGQQGSPGCLWIVNLYNERKGLFYCMKRFAHTLMIIVVPIIITGHAYAQTVSDSLLEKTSASKEDTNKVKIWLAIADEKANNEPVRAAEYARSAEALSMRLFFDPGIYKARISIANT